MTGEEFKNKARKVGAFIKKIAVRVWAYLKVAKMEWITVVAVFSLDLIAKSLVENYLDYGVTVPMIPYFLSAHKTHNVGAVFGSTWLNNLLGGVGSRIFFCVFAVAASVAFALLLIRQKGKSKIFRFSLALFIAGAMGNCIDRMFLAYVRDFIVFVFFDLKTMEWTEWRYIFNIADVALVSGVCLVIFYFLFLYKDTDKKKLGDGKVAEGVDQTLLDSMSARVNNSDDAELAVPPDETAPTENATEAPSAEATDESAACETPEASDPIDAEQSLQAEEIRSAEQSADDAEETDR